ncbi:hypothetical protein [Umezawaea endophytica]|uniref:hypothetical protein n=1 Tax=Umezawaea endophytica TaxID=1654476 RepID=UPI0036DA11F3
MHQQPTDASIAHSRVQQLSSPSCSAKPLVEALADLDLLHDDRGDPMHAWIERRSAALPPGFAHGVRAWLLLDGDDPGRTPRSTSAERTSRRPSRSNLPGGFGSGSHPAGTMAKTPAASPCPFCAKAMGRAPEPLPVTQV